MDTAVGIVLLLALVVPLVVVGIDAPVLEWRGARLVRISIAPYNEWADVERLAGELERLVGAV